MSDETSPPPWPTVQVHPPVSYAVFSLLEVDRRSPRTGAVGRFQILTCSPWVNVIAITEDDEIVLVRQFRHGTAACTVEIPGGLVDPGEGPAEAAARELLEETGFAGLPPVPLGSVEPNPAIQDNVCSTWLVQSARRISAPRPDDMEQLEVLLLPRADVDEWILEGKIRHALVIAAFKLLELHQQPSRSTG
jgi:ADP-ribose pyrophosphatase